MSAPNEDFWASIAGYAAMTQGTIDALPRSERVIWLSFMSVLTRESLTSQQIDDLDSAIAKMTASIDSAF